MRRWIALGAMLCGLHAPGAARAAVILELSDSSGNPNVTTVDPGGSFSVDVSLLVTGAEQVIGLGFWLTEPTNAWSSGNGLLLTGRFIPVDSPFDDPITADAVLTSSPGSRLDPINDRDAGALTDGTPYDPLNDPAVIMELTLQATANMEPGQYSLRLSNSPQGIGLEWVDSAHDPHAFDSLGTNYLIHVLPEPATAALLALGLAGLAARSRARPPR